jgi:outer membrane protein assembly factor BamB
MKLAHAMLVTVMIASFGVRAEDWPQFRGPGGAGISRDKPPSTWDDSKNVLWKTPLPGPGSSSPIVVGDHVFVTCFSGYGAGGNGGDVTKLKRHLVCVNRKDGKIAWTGTVDAVLPEDPYRGQLTEHGYASNTPASDGEVVYAFFGKSGVVAFDMNGQKLWQTSVGKESDRKGWGSATSPILYKNLVIVNASSESQSIRALDKKTGKQVWSQEASSLEASYSTPAPVDLGGGKMELAVAVPGEVWGMNPDTGKLLWYASTRIAGNVVPSVVSMNGVVFVSGGFESRGTTAVRAGGNGDVTKSHVVWSVSDSTYIPSPVAAGGYLFWVSDEGRATCLDAASGKILGQQRLAITGGGGRGRGKPIYASTVMVGDKLVAVTRSSGVFVLSATPQLQPLATNRLSEEAEFNAAPAVAGGQLFLRSTKSLYCIGSN